MRKRKIALFANNKAGIEIAKFFGDSYFDEVGVIYLTAFNDETDKKIINSSKLENRKIFYGNEILDSKDHINWFQEQNFDAIVCVYWPWILKPEIFKYAKKTINFHPALLPINRGWYPHVHNILNKSPAGVTLHEISKGADEGNIWVQKKVEISPYDTAKSLYLKLQDEIIKLFKKNWELIITNKIESREQDHTQANYHSKSEINDLDKIDIDGDMSIREFIQLLKARSFGDLGFAFYEDQKTKVFLNLRLSDTKDFD